MLGGRGQGTGAEGGRQQEFRGAVRRAERWTVDRARRTLDADSPRFERRCTVDWWVWVVVVMAAAIVLIASTLWTQARRRRGGAIAVPRGRAGKRGAK